MADTQLAFLGAGRMATALAHAVIKAGLFTAEQVAASDPSPEARQAFGKATGIRQVGDDNRGAIQGAETIILAVKPNQAAGVLAELKSGLQREQRLISIAAGISLSQLDAMCGQLPRLVRVMPNTPCLVGKGAAAFALGPRATLPDGEFVRRFFSSLGLVFCLDEKHLDAVTGLSGSGPAYACLFIEALSDGGVLMGLPRDVATSLAAQTLLGTAAMVLETGRHPAELREQVTSPGGTTMAGLAVLESQAVRGAIVQAVRAAAQRSTELAKAASNT